MNPPAGRLAANLEQVRERLRAAAHRAERDPRAVRLVAVTKTVDPDTIRALADLGVRDVGENRVADGCAKAAALAPLGLTWHFIGHLQRNKAAAALRYFRTIHSVESPRLVEVLQREAEKRDLRLRLLLEVNLSGEASKYGLAPRATGKLLRAVAERPRLRAIGLMTMAPLVTDPEQARPVFRGLRELRDRLRDETGLALPELSMGMSNDFEVAVEEGATLVRVGSALFR